jgi:GxxExxY protein
MYENEISNQIINAAIAVHNYLGPGLLESSYKECLFYELNQKEFKVLKEVAQPLIYRGIKLDCGYRIDLLVENKVIIEIKSVEAFNDVHLAQVLTYLKLAHCKLGLLLNFNVTLMKYGIKRVVNHL